MNRLLAVAMVLLAGSLAALPHVSTQLHIAIYAAVMGLAGGFVIVIFFSFWSAAYGRKHLGKIQGSARPGPDRNRLRPRPLSSSPKPSATPAPPHRFSIF